MEEEQHPMEIIEVYRGLYRLHQNKDEAQPVRRPTQLDLHLIQETTTLHHHLGLSDKILLIRQQSKKTRHATVECRLLQGRPQPMHLPQKVLSHLDPLIRLIRG